MTGPTRVREELKGRRSRDTPDVAWGEEVMRKPTRRLAAASHHAEVLEDLAEAARSPSSA